ncbi:MULTISPECIES: phosphatase PAP2 family protein [Photorhabdus]|uniref:Phosphatidylglycerophosphatase B n=1 Tax=Photorhabdus asymbiotica subsp. asymbiotica (strain ATCC 43949 / 3105-77) TaxID=553480 RepID=C7BJA3_PHOAA|nr:phosphatidylglycerophosphatase B [Photorhabdus asymbiotica]CAQ84171.1 phosphatidylglycerophosphatase B [Photorhabdus asymbiotica]
MVAIVTARLLVGQGKRDQLKILLRSLVPISSGQQKITKYQRVDFISISEKRKQRAKLLEQYLRIDHRIPQWQLIHWKNETAEIDFELQRGS